jgi:hypothetical protein
VNTVYPLTLGRGFDFDDVASTIDEGSEKRSHDEFDLYFACEERGVVGRKSVGAEPLGARQYPMKADE